MTNQNDERLQTSQELIKEIAQFSSTIKDNVENLNNALITITQTLDGNVSKFFENQRKAFETCSEEVKNLQQELQNSENLSPEKRQQLTEQVWKYSQGAVEARRTSMKTPTESAGGANPPEQQPSKNQLSQRKGSVENETKSDSTFPPGSTETSTGFNFNSVIESVTKLAIGGGGGLEDVATEILPGIAEQLGTMIPGIGTIVNVVSLIAGGLDKLNSLTTKSLSTADNFINSMDIAGFDSRLYGIITDAETGLNANFIDMASDAIDLVTGGAQLFIDEQELIKNMSNLVSKGIHYNIEQRAMWETMSDKIVASFEVTNETLTNLVKLQQTDLTGVYMGTEAALTRTLNSMFKDTTYIENVYDAVWSAMQDSLANVSSTVGTEIAYQVQLWLGSLSSVGMSSNAATGIASAINALLTGNVSKLGDQGQTLLAMAASESGMSFADLLVNGVGNGNDMSDLMSGIVSVLQDIYSQSKDNNVLLSEWGNILNLSITDWKAISNLTNEEISILRQQSNYNSADALNELQYIEDNLVAERTLIQERISNLLSNTTFEAGWDLATDTEDYLTWKISEEIANLTSGWGLAGKVVDLLDTLNRGALSIKYWIGPLGDLIKGGLKLVSATDYSSFYNSTNVKGGTTGQFVGELFDFIMNGSGYVDYDAVKKQSYYRTQNASASVKLDTEEQKELVSSESVTETTSSSAAPSSTSTSSTETETVAEAATSTGTTTNSSDTTTGNGTEELTSELDTAYNYILDKEGLPVRVIGWNAGDLKFNIESSTASNSIYNNFFETGTTTSAYNISGVINSITNETQ